MSIEGEAVETTGTEAVETPAAAEGGEAGAENAAELPEYAPNYKFKYRAVDRSEAEGEFDDAFKPLVKDSAAEKRIRELYEKAHGLDFVKQDRDTLKQTYTETQQAYETQASALRTLGTFVQNKDYDSFFEALKIPKTEVLNYALQLVQLEKMDPQQRAQFDRQRSEQQQMLALQMQNSELTQQFQQMAVQGRETELDSTLQHPEVVGMVQEFDQRAGRPGAFRDLVVQKGQHHFFSSGIDVPVRQAIQEVVQLLGLKPQQPGQNPAQAPAPAQRSSAGKPVLPHVSGKGTSPAKKVLNSTDAIRKHAAQLGA